MSARTEKFHLFESFTSHGSGEVELIVDFTDGWHCALKLRPGMSRMELASELHSFEDLILKQRGKQARWTP